jgi:hypothetical protein
MAQVSEAPGKLPKRHPPMDGLPLHEQFRFNHWRTLIDGAGPGDLDALRQISHQVLDYAIVNRAFALQQAAALLPRQEKTPAAEAAGAQSPPDQNSSS